MLRIDRVAKTFAQLPERKLSEAGILERHDIQAMIVASPDAFFGELRENIKLLAQEFRPDDVVDDRIDLLGTDEDGTAVIIELKRGNHRMHLLQALSYASMLSKLDGAKFVDRVALFAGYSSSQILETLDDFIDGGAATINNSQRIILIAEDFDYSVLVTSEWLSERYGVDIRCYRLRLAGDAATAEFLACERVYPPAEFTDIAVRVHRPTPERHTGYKDWNEALEGIDNKALVDFYRKELSNGRKGYLYRRILNWSQNGHRRFWMIARKNYAYGWQIGRFEGDLDFWRTRLGGDEKDVAEVGRFNNRVRFRLRTPEQFAAFREATDGPLANKPFVNTAIPGDEADASTDAEDEDEEGNSATEIAEPNIAAGTANSG